MEITTVLDVTGGKVKVLHDTKTDSYSIGLRTLEDMEWKFISKELHDLLIKELKGQEGRCLQS